MDLHVKYRPEDFSDMIGQDAVVSSVRNLMDQDRVPKAFLFYGNSGTGKTTICRIIAKELGAVEPSNLVEIDGATFTGIDAMREIADSLRYRALGKSPIKFVIIDECHRLSKNAWDSLLKIIEEPPDHVYFAFCTTVPAKVQRTIKTRCTEYHLKDVDTEDIADLIDEVCDIEDIELPDGASMLIAGESFGSPRRALTYLTKCIGTSTLDEVSGLLESVVENETVLEFCRVLVKKGTSWESVLPLLKDLKNYDPVAVQIQVCNYLNSCILNSKSPAKAHQFMELLEIFLGDVYSSNVGYSQILHMAGQVFLLD